MRLKKLIGKEYNKWVRDCDNLSFFSLANDQTSIQISIQMKIWIMQEDSPPIYIVLQPTTTCNYQQQLKAERSLDAVILNNESL